jgi:hypothetical protein
MVSIRYTRPGPPVGDAGHSFDWHINIGSTSIRAYQHSARALKSQPPTPSEASRGAAQRPVQVRTHVVSRRIPIVRMWPLGEECIGSW